MKHNSTSRFMSQLWAGFYVFASIIPLLILIYGKGPSKISFWWDFSIALGVGAATLIFLMSVLTARFGFIAGPFGIDVIYYFHRQVSYVIAGLVIIHPVILLVVEPLLVYELRQPISAIMLSGLLATCAVLVQVFISIGRCWLKIEYDIWRILHILLALTALFSILVHMISVNYYTSTRLQTGLWILLATIWIFSFLYVRFIRPINLLRKPYTVKSVENAGSDTWNLSLLPENHPGMRFQAGQFAWLSVNQTPFAIKEHPFSFSGSEEDQALLFSIKVLGDFSSRIKYLEPGTKVYVDGAYGVFTYERFPAPGYVFIAGGIGIAPIMSMLRTMADRNVTQDLMLIYGNKSEDTSIFTNEIEHLKSKLKLEVIHVYSQPGANWEGEVGLIDRKLLNKHISQKYMEYHYFICGPNKMMRTVEKSLHEIGVTYRNIHTEIFNMV